MKRAPIAALAALTFVAAVAVAQNSTTETQSKTPTALEQKTPSVKTIAEKTTGMQKLPGFFTYYWDAREGKVWLQIDKWDVPFLYYESLPNGVGSNDVGLDRGQPGRTSVVHFERIGPRVLLVAEMNATERLPTIWSSERRSNSPLLNLYSGGSKSLPRIKMGKLFWWTLRHSS